MNPSQLSQVVSPALRFPTYITTSLIPQILIFPDIPPPLNLKHREGQRSSTHTVRVSDLLMCSTSCGLSVVSMCSSKNPASDWRDFQQSKSVVTTGCNRKMSVTFMAETVIFQHR